MISKSVMKTYIKLPNHIRIAVHNKLTELAEDPYTQHLDVKRLQGYQDIYRLRVSDWRVLYQLYENDTIKVIKIAHRKEVYKQ